MSPPFDPKLMKSQTEHDALRFKPVYYGVLDLAYVYRVYRQPYDANNPLAPEEVTEQEYQAYPAAQQLLELVVKVDGSSFNPNQPFVYQRKLRVGGPPRNRDFWQILVPSANSVLGTLEKLVSGLWVCVEDVPSARDPNYNTAKLIGVYPTEAACAKAWAKTRTELSIPPDILALAETLRVAASNDEKEFAKLVTADAVIAQYGADRLWKATEPKK